MGGMSTADLQEIARAIQLGGNADEEMDGIASCGSYGTQPGNVHRDLMRKFCHELWAPGALTYTIPCKDRTGRAGQVLFTDINMYLPSDWFCVWANNPNMEYEFEAIFGPPR